MNAGLKITAFAAAVAATFGTAYGVGKGVGPLVADEQTAGHGGHGKEKEKEGGAGGGHGGHEDASPAPGGLQISEGGYTLALETPRVTAGDRTKLRFSIQDEDGRKVTAYEREHGKELHFIVASRDLTVYRHLHPTRAADGTWSTSADLPEAGAYRAFADFKPAKKGAEALTLGADPLRSRTAPRTPTDRLRDDRAGPGRPRPRPGDPATPHHQGLAVAGKYTPADVPAPATTAKVDGYEVTLTGGLRPGKSAELKLNVAKNGKPVTDLQPYLGAYGHLVALRSGDLAYLHVHPNGEPDDGTTTPGPEVSFTATAPSSGTYRLFLDFQHDGEVRTAAFTVKAGTTAGASEPADDTHDQESPGHRH